MNVQAILASTVAMYTDQLTDLELAVLNNVAQTDDDPHGRLFDYSKVAGLFSEAGGVRMHAETKEALARVVLARLGG